MVSLEDFNKIDLNKKIKLGLGFSILVLMISSFVSFYSIQKLIQRSKWVDHTNKVIVNLEHIKSVLRSAETAQRGYLLTGEVSFLKPYIGSSTNTLALCDKVEQLTKDNAIQQEHIKVLRPLVKRRFAKMEYVMGSYRQTGKPALSELVLGQQMMDSCLALVSKMQEEENALLKIRVSEAQTYAYYSPMVILVTSILALLISIFSFYFITKDIRSKALVQSELKRLNQELEMYNDEIEKSRSELNKQNYLLVGNAKLNDLLRIEKNLHKSGESILGFLCEFTKSQVSTLYIQDDDGTFKLTNTCALKADDAVTKHFEIGEGLLGHTALCKKPMLLKDIPHDGMRIQSAMISVLPANILIMPFVHDEQTIAVMELLSKDEFNTLDIEFVESVGRVIAIYIKNIKAEMKMTELLEETQRQAEELEAQQDVLKQINEELEEQANSLKMQQEELQVANEELEHQAKSIENKNKELEKAQVEVEKKTADLELSSKYKSEFLANMSHELRTPLNSLLILSKDLADNKKNNLEPYQVESAQIIYNSGQDLLQLINEILDLSKIEAGKMELYMERLNLASFANGLARNFKHMAEKKNLQFIIHLEDGLPEHIVTDRQRLEQILRNLLSNAIKFTHQGSITVSFRKHDAQTVALEVIDTGIGIAEDKQALVFEAFQQADGGTARKYGGTGLGLSISKELAKLIKGKIVLKSKSNEGSTFTLLLPLDVSEHVDAITAPVEITPVAPKEPAIMPKIEHIPDDRDDLVGGDRILLIIEDDATFSKILMRQAQNRKFKVLVAPTGEEGLELAEKYTPNAIILDLHLPRMDGQAVLSELKNNPYLRHIPVHIISASDRSVDVIRRGAMEFLKKPVDSEDLEKAFTRIENVINRKMKNLLIVEDDKNAVKAMKLLIGNGDVKCWDAQTGTDALRIVKEKEIDCIVLDLVLPDMSGFDFIEQLEKEGKDTVPPIIIYTGKDLSKEESEKLHTLAESIII
ncbi:MAG TPA: response regulator, partial [Cytophagales bacterium]|nr:response regulator [Cytophagales bacterium]